MKVRLVPLPQAILLHLKVDSLNPFALTKDLDTAHVLLEVVHQLLGIGAGLEPLEAEVFREMVGEVDNEDAQVETDAGSWLVETLREFEVV